MNTLAAIAAVTLSFAQYTEIADKWTPFTVKKGGFSVLMPGTPIESPIQTLHTGRGTIYVHVYWCTTPSEVFGVSYAEPAPGVTSESPREMIASARNGFKNASGGKLLSERQFKYDGKLAAEFEFPAKGGICTSQVFCAKNLCCGLMTVRPRGHGVSEDQRKFIRSFKFISKTAIR